MNTRYTILKPKSKNKQANHNSFILIYELAEGQELCSDLWGSIFAACNMGKPHSLQLRLEFLIEQSTVEMLIAEWTLNTSIRRRAEVWSYVLRKWGQGTRSLTLFERTWAGARQRGSCYSGMSEIILEPLHAYNPNEMNSQQSPMRDAEASASSTLFLSGHAMDMYRRCH